MVALVEHVQRGPVAVHATYLRPDGNGKAGSVPRGEWIAVAEGVETALSIMVASAIPAWAALSAGGLERLALPPEAGMVLICADNDANGVGARAARTAGQRFLAEGRRVRLTSPPRVGDFNDVLLGLALSRSGEVRRVAD
jgi:phage/plasmid primase-like uncharacterized protein